MEWDNVGYNLKMKRKHFETPTLHWKLHDLDVWIHCQVNGNYLSNGKYETHGCLFHGEPIQNQQGEYGKKYPMQTCFILLFVIN